MDRGIVEKARINGKELPFYGIRAGKLRREINFKNISDMFRVAGGYFDARRLLKELRPELLFSKGGFVSVPPCAAAASLGIPVYTHESDLSPGLATRLNARFAKRIFTGYAATERCFGEAARGKVIHSGNPIRAAFATADGSRGRAFLGVSPEERILLVLGGSSGSEELNGLVEATLGRLTEYYTVVHQTGRPVDDAAAKAHSRHLPFQYIHSEMPDVIAAAEVVLCRAGAGTRAECGALGKPLVLLPLRGSSTRGDQVENAEYMQESGAAQMLASGAAAVETLPALVKEIHDDEALRRRMGEKAREISPVDAAGRIARIIVEDYANRNT
jgi:UDP-N-acetylglucosamine--N-acetylmuramyl-(pentapeptide) pyrophosphoryl-undecaprenol N-acetylglucosamine transferase